MAYQMVEPVAAAVAAAVAGAVAAVISNNPHAADFVPQNHAAYEAFVAVDTDKSGAIEWNELQDALKAFAEPGRKFPGGIARCLVRCHDTDQNGSLGYSEFEELFMEIGSWRDIFLRAGGGRSHISYAELAQEWDKLGLGLNDQCKSLALDSLTPDDGSDSIAFVDFIRLLAELKSLVKFVQNNSGADGTMHLNADALVLGFYGCRG